MKKEQLPRKYQKLVKRFERASGLIDNCKYVMYLEEGVLFAGEEVLSLPVRSKRDAIELLKGCESA